LGKQITAGDRRALGLKWSTQLNANESQSYFNTQASREVRARESLPCRTAGRIAIIAILAAMLPALARQKQSSENQCEPFEAMGLAMAQYAEATAETISRITPPPQT
jgi:hypothetical protein